MPCWGPVTVVVRSRGTDMHRFKLRLLSLAVLALACLLAAPSVAAKKARPETAPAVPSGTPTVTPDEVGYARTASVRETTNAAGQTVYAVSASHFDVSAPLRDMAKVAPLQEAVEEEGPENPELPDFRKIRSEVP